jgi:hypothetical protein
MGVHNELNRPSRLRLLRRVLFSVVFLAVLFAGVFFGKKPRSARGSVVKYLLEPGTIDPQNAKLAKLLDRVHSEYERNTQ